MKPMDTTNPVDAITHSEKRSLIPTTEQAGEEMGVASKKPAKGEYQNTVIERGQDPELFWLNKYQNDDEQTKVPYLKVDTRSLYVHEDIRPEALINRLYKIKKGEHFTADLFGANEPLDDLDRVASYYKHTEDWQNRLIQGDSLLVMNSLLQREGMAGQVQCVYIDPPYGIKYASNWQMRLHDRNVKDGDDNLTGEPEMIKAFRDTWEKGIHSYLSYLRDRLVLSRELLHESGSVFVQISDENVHLVRNIMDEVFGSENFVSMISVEKTSGTSSTLLATINDFIIWYAKEKNNVKYRQLYKNKELGKEGATQYTWIEVDGIDRRISEFDLNSLPKNGKIFAADNCTSMGKAKVEQPFTYNGKVYYPSSNAHWKPSYPAGMEMLAQKNRLKPIGNSLMYKRYLNDFPIVPITNIWDDTKMTGFTETKLYVVQTAASAIQRCILMTTDPGDLVLDPTCGSGTSAYVAEQWGRRWITIDTSRIALNIAKTRLLSATFAYYKLFDNIGGNIRQGFVYKKVPHITLKSLANNEPAAEEILYDKPEEDKSKIRVAGPFTVETLQNYNPTSPESLDFASGDENRLFMERIFAHLQSSGIRNGIKNEQAVFTRVEAVSSEFLHARGFYIDSAGVERLAYFHIGPKFGTVSKVAVNKALQEFRSRNAREGASWLAILGFSFEDTINRDGFDMDAFQISIVRMADDLMQDGLLKNDKKAASFVTIGEPDIVLHKKDDAVTVEIRGLDIYDPIKDEVKARNIEDIAYWEIDDDYDGRQFIVRSIHFCGGDKKEFATWRKGLESAASKNTKKKAEDTLHLEFNEEIWETLYGFESEPIAYTKGKKIAVRVVSQFGEESSKVLVM